jgi:antitoxin HicB
VAATAGADDPAVDDARTVALSSAVVSLGDRSAPGLSTPAGSTTSKGAGSVTTVKCGTTQEGRVPLILSEQPGGGYSVTSPALPELITEGDTVEEALAHVPDALAAVVELYEDLSKPVPLVRHDRQR